MSFEREPDDGWDLSPDQDEIPPDDSPRSIPPHSSHGAEPRRGRCVERAERTRFRRRSPPQSRSIFPIVGAAKYFDDWGDPRGQGRHAGNDILTTWRSPAVAAEDGKIKFWTTSARAGCMLYLYGASGTTYLYIHLNNDLTAKRDNRGKCVPGVAYADGLKDGARVKAGQQIAYNGDSGDAEGIYHLHFEVHPNDGADVNPFPYLNEATRLLFALPAKPAKAVTLGLKGMPVSAGGGHARALGDRRPRLARRGLDDDPGALGRARRARGRAPRPVGRRADRRADPACARARGRRAA